MTITLQIIIIIKIISLPCSSLLILQWTWRWQKYENVAKLLCMPRAIRLIETRIDHIIMYSWPKATYMWLVIGFPQISHADTFQYKGLNFIWHPFWLSCIIGICFTRRKYKNVLSGLSTMIQRSITKWLL